jgi:endonuclease/exonuclease/phosphatase family metal-dependent hydrolase
MYQTDSYRILHPTVGEYNSSHESFSKIDHILEHKASLKYKKIKTISCILSDHNGIKLEISNRRNYRKYPDGH